MNPSPRRSLLMQAARTIEGERDEEYGPPTENFARIADLWNDVFREKLALPFDPSDVALAMLAMKLVRLSFDPSSRDTWMDVAGYAGCGWECAEMEQKP